MAVADWLALRRYLPDAVITSSARRTVETWERMAPHLPEPAQVKATDALYLAGPDMILRVIRDQSASRLMVICHNPGIAEFAAMIVRSAPDHPRFGDYPTAATTVIEFDTDNWGEVTWGSGRALDFTVPRDLTG